VGYGLLVDPVVSLGGGSSPVSHVLPLGSDVRTVTGEIFASTALLSDLPTETAWKRDKIDPFIDFLKMFQAETRCASHAVVQGSASSPGGRHADQSASRNEKDLQPSFDRIEDSLNKNGMTIDVSQNSVTGIDNNIKPIYEIILDNHKKLIYKIDDNDKIFDQIKSAAGRGGDSSGLAMAGAGLATSLLTMLLMGIWVWSWRRSLDALLRKLDLESRPRVSEDAANAKPPSAPPGTVIGA
jgi:hypothetical protein